MKPSWDEAPEWACYLTMDSDGLWCWHGEHEPKQNIEGYWISSLSSIAYMDYPLPIWINTLEERPK